MRALLRTVRAAREAASNDEGFRQELIGESLFAASSIGAIQVILAILIEMLNVAWHGAPGGMLALGVATWLSSRHPRLYPYARAVAVCSCWLWCAILVLVAPPALFATLVAAMLLLAAALIPLAFWQALLAFAPILALDAVSPLGADDRWVLAAVACAGVVLAVAQMVHRWSVYSAHLRLVQSSQDLRLVQAKSLSAEHAASLERLAAAISHELNTPVGALRSAVDTLQQLRARYEGASPSRRERLEALQGEIHASLLAAAGRIQEIVGRLQRFSNLDRATVRPTDMNLLLRDAVAMIEAGGHSKVAIGLELKPVPVLLCETQAWTTIFSSLVSYGIAQCAPGSTLPITSQHSDGEIVVEMAIPGGDRAAGNGMDPGFVAEGGRVGTANWSLFHVRLWIRQQGGELRQISDADRGLITRVSIPAGNAATSAARSGG
jgi:signal transduction histidine kinase